MPHMKGGRIRVLALTGAWRFLVSDLTDGAVRCRLGGFGWALTGAS